MSINNAPEDDVPYRELDILTFFCLMLLSAPVLMVFIGLRV